jgi:predicted XRE-type DNA-binding protein
MPRAKRGSRTGTTVDSLWSELGILADVRKARPKIKVEQFENVWDALESDPAERERLKLRSQLMEALRDRIARWKTTQSEAAKRLSITQPRLNELLKGRFSKFSLGALFDLATRAGLKVRLSIDPPSAKPKAKAKRAA